MTREDCISRQALIERINNAEENFKADHMESIASDDGDPFVDGVLSGVFNIREMVAQAPSVTPTRKKGHWIMTNDYFTGAYGTIDYVKCSCCCEDSLEEGNFCPNCGAEMESEE